MKNKNYAFMLLAIIFVNECILNIIIIIFGSSFLHVLEKNHKKNSWKKFKLRKKNLFVKNLKTFILFIFRN